MLKKIIAFSASYAMTEALQKGIMFFLMSLFTYYMTTEEYGIISSALIIIQFLSVVFSLSSTAAISRYYFTYSNDSEKLKEFIGSSFLLLFFTALIFLSVCLFLGKPFFIWLFPEIPYYPYLIWIFLICTLQPFNMAYLALLKSQQRIKSYSILYSIFYIVQFGLMAATILSKGMKQDGYILSILLSNVVFMFVVIWFLAKEARWSFKKDYIIPSLKYSFSFLPTELFTIANALIDRFYILGILSLSALGIYQIGIQIGALLVLITRALNYAYLPHFMIKYESEDKDYKEIYNFADLFVLITVVITGILTIISPYFIVQALDKAYVDAKNVVVFINFMYALNSIYFINVNVLSLTPKLVRLKTLFVIIGGLINLTLNYILISSYGLIGAAIATLIGFLITNILLTYCVRKMTSFVFNSFKNILYVSLSFFIVFFMFQISLDHNLMNSILLIIIYVPLSFLLFGIIHRKHPTNYLNFGFDESR